VHVKAVGEREALASGHGRVASGLVGKFLNMMLAERVGGKKSVVIWPV